MPLGRMAIIAYVIFLGLYSWYKYSVAAPPEFDIGYARSVVILVLMTAVAPFALTYGVLKLAGLARLSALLTGLGVGLVVCVAGYAAFWWFFIVPGGAAPAVYDVAIRGVGWGLLQGGLASIATNH
ncbi:MAG: hypothetical protein GXP06_10630 [Alphaproteobacteria bacterium]|nr:hypothetical protein [Alphaproteobacteria bacterium]